MHCLSSNLSSPGYWTLYFFRWRRTLDGTHLGGSVEDAAFADGSTVSLEEATGEAGGAASVGEFCAGTASARAGKGDTSCSRADQTEESRRADCWPARKAT